MNREDKKMRSILPGVFLVAFLAAVVTFVVLLSIEKKELSAFEKEEYYMVCKEIPKGMEVTESMLEEYFILSSMDKNSLPVTHVSDLHTLVGSRAQVKILQGSVVTDNLFAPKETLKDKVKKPVIAGCKSDDLYQMVSGILRSGDSIHIYTVDEETGETYLLWNDVKVYQVFDASGNLIQPQDSTSAAARINIVMEETDAELFYTKLYQGSLRVVKTWE